MLAQQIPTFVAFGLAAWRGCRFRGPRFCLVDADGTAREGTLAEAER